MTSRAGWARRFATFVGVGLLATAVHLAVAWIVTSFTSPLVANAAGFGVALSVTYLGNYFWTFRTTAGHRETGYRFVVVSAATLAISEWSLVLLDQAGANERGSLLIAVALIPLLRFAAFSTHVFVDGEPTGSLVSWTLDLAIWFGLAVIGVVGFRLAARQEILDAGSTFWSTDTAGDNRLLELLASVGEPVLGTTRLSPSWLLLGASAIGPSAAVLAASMGLGKRWQLVAVGLVAALSPTLVFDEFQPHSYDLFVSLLLAAILTSIVRSRRSMERMLLPATTMATLTIVAMLVRPELLALGIVVAVLAVAGSGNSTTEPGSQAQA